MNGSAAALRFQAMSEGDRLAALARMRCMGFSIRSIAELTGLTQSQVVRWTLEGSQKRGNAAQSQPARAVTSPEYPAGYPEGRCDEP